MRTSIRNLALALAGALLATACANTPNSLNGSLSDVYDIHFESVRARIYSSELAIEYVDVTGAVPVRVTLRLVDTVPAAGTSYDLAEVGDVTGRSDDDVEIPRFNTGKLDLDAYERTSGALVSGSFRSKYSTGRDSLSLNGDFDTTLEIVDRTPGE